jgi:metal-responsive CopG/Arc/MetJ family transcriptional regulator
MRTTKVAISINKETIEKLDRLVEKRIFPSRSSAIQEAIDEKLTRFERVRLAEECAKLDPIVEQSLADEGLSQELAQWPEY